MTSVQHFLLSIKHFGQYFTNVEAFSQLFNIVELTKLMLYSNVRLFSQGFMEVAVELEVAY